MLSSHHRCCKLSLFTRSLKKESRCGCCSLLAPLMGAPLPQFVHPRCGPPSARSRAGRVWAATTDNTVANQQTAHPGARDPCLGPRRVLRGSTTSMQPQCRPLGAATGSHHLIAGSSPSPPPCCCSVLQAQWLRARSICPLSFAVSTRLERAAAVNWAFHQPLPFGQPGAVVS